MYNILSNKKIIFYKLLHKYILICKIIQIPDIIKIITELIRFDKELLSIIYMSTGGN